MIKPFDPATHAACDSVAMKETQKIMADIYGADLVRNNNEAGGCKEGKWDQSYAVNGSVVLTEAEMKQKKWWGTQFIGTTYRNSNEKNPYPFEWQSVDVPERKKDNLALIFFVISDACDFAWIISRNMLLSSNIKNKKCRVSLSSQWTLIDDKFFEVPTKSGVFLQKKDERWTAFVESDNDRLQQMLSGREPWEQKLQEVGRQNLLNI